MTKANGSTQHASTSSFPSLSTVHCERTKLRIMLGCLLLSCCLAMTMTATAAVVPVPYIDSTWPISATPGGAGFLLTLWGTEFVSGATVNWTVGCTTTPLHAIFISSIEVQAEVPSSLIATAGTATITVVNPAPIPSSNPVFFTISNAFTPSISATNYTVGAFSTLFNRPIGVGDFNHDCILDLAVGNAGAGTVSILKGLVGGGFAPGPVYTVGLQPVGIAVADFNHDGWLDLAVANFGDATVDVLLGGPGGFTLFSTLSFGCCPRDIKTADFDGDGKLDLVVVGYDGYTPWVRIFKGNGNGTFVPPVNIALPGSIQPTGVSVGDFNGDGFLDLAVTDVLANHVRILGGPGFTSGPTIPTLDNPAPVALGDFTGHAAAGSGTLDMAVSNLYENSVSIFQGSSTGPFSLWNTFPVGDGPFAISAGNFDGNQYLDLVVGNHFGNTATIWHNGGPAGFAFTPVATAPAGDGPVFVAIGDFNGNGKMDYVTGAEYNNTVTVGLQ